MNSIGSNRRDRIEHIGLISRQDVQGIDIVVRVHRQDNGWLRGERISSLANPTTTGDFCNTP